MDKDAKMIFEAYTGYPDVIRVCTICAKEHPELVNLHEGQARSDGLCKRHQIAQLELDREKYKNEPGAEVKFQRMIDYFKAQPEKSASFSPDFEKVAR